MTELYAYADRIGLRPGERTAVKVSCTGADSYRADLVRLGGPEAGEEMPPFREDVVAAAGAGEHPGRHQPVACGSWGLVPPSPRLAPDGAFTLSAFVWPSRPRHRREALLGCWSEAARRGFGLMLDAAGRPECRIGDGREVVALTAAKSLAARRWVHLCASLDPEKGRLSLSVRPLADSVVEADLSGGVQLLTGVRPDASRLPFLFAAWHEGDGAEPEAPHGWRVGGLFNGRIDRPRLHAAALSPEGSLTTDGTGLVAAWDFGADIPTETFPDSGPHRLHGRTVNLPTRAVTGHNWDGSAMDWRHAPQQYAAIHFHESDLADARWRTDFELTVPDDAPSGAYAVRLSAGGEVWRVPLFVRARRPSAPVVFLAPTATYQAYANNSSRHVAPLTELYQGRLTVIDRHDMALLRHPEFGASCYDRHGDGSGVCYSSRLRPVTSLQADWRLWNYPADLFVLDWLAQSGQAHEVVTDEDLHLEGLEAIAPYRVLVTGSHPEYWSKEMLDALDAWLRRGGRLMYLGGNGFYWRIAFQPGNPAVMEVRRAEDGVRAWIAEPGEYYHSFTGEYGGLWRRQGRPPNHVAGVGFIAQGFDHSTPYRRLEASRDPRAAFIFEGVEDEILGDFGANMGGAAGLELDSYNVRLGSPRHALVVARSQDHSNVYETVNEELAVGHGATDGTMSADVHADMVFYEVPGGGAVFSTGSIAYAGALGVNGFDNSIARLTTNVLRRFADPEPFVMPEAD